MPEKERKASSCRYANAQQDVLLLQVNFQTSQSWQRRVLAGCPDVSHHDEVLVVTWTRLNQKCWLSGGVRNCPFLGYFTEIHKICTLDHLQAPPLPSCQCLCLDFCSTWFPPKPFLQPGFCPDSENQSCLSNIFSLSLPTWCNSSGTR